MLFRYCHIILAKGRICKCSFEKRAFLCREVSRRMLAALRMAAVKPLCAVWWRTTGRCIPRSTVCWRSLQSATKRIASATVSRVWRGSEPHPRACAFPYPHRGRLDHFVIGELSYAPSQPLRGGFAVRLTEALPPKAIPYIHATGVVNKNPCEKVFRLVTAVFLSCPCS